MKWYEQLRFERISRGWTQRLLAEKVGTNKFTVTRWEKGVVFPTRFYREQLATLLAINFEEREFVQAIAQCNHNTAEEPAFASEEESVDIEHNASLPLSVMQLVNALAEDRQAHEQERHRATDHPFLSRSLRDLARSYCRNVLTFRLPHRLSWHPLFLGSMVMLVVLLIAGGLPAFTKLPFLGGNEKQVSPSPSNTHAGDTDDPPLYTLAIQNADPSLQDTDQHLQQAFKAVYPQLVNRFALDPATALKNVILTLASDQPSPASISGTTITLSADWMRQHTNDVGLLTHELTLLLERYPSRAPAWFADGMADYARSVYEPADDDWSLPDSVQPHQSYRQGGAIAARFLRWVELHTRPDIVDQLHHALQKGQSFSTVFQSLTHNTVDRLWNQYQAYPDITPTPQQRYTIAISRKPLLQSSFHLLQNAYPDTALWDYAQGLYLSNFVMQADITIVTGDSGAGFFFRNDDRSWRCVYLFPTGMYRLDDRYQPGILTFNSAIKMGLNQTNRLTIIVERFSIYMYINSQFITRIDDTNLLSYGTLGVMITTYNTSPANIRFEKVQVF